MRDEQIGNLQGGLLAAAVGCGVLLVALASKMKNPVRSQPHDPESAIRMSEKRAYSACSEGDENGDAEAEKIVGDNIRISIRSDMANQSKLDLMRAVDAKHTVVLNPLVADTERER
ncbi:hypothetical protein CYMTET_26447 [Cymbomonas tetramitiformis]|uniref:Uncharacterized protein n=1 Tax=Cymbomonas tetramitiformis TaxID=36881 RepID=A0AAE0FRV8_9CHLO|nr:hypothetical protein CYMTET_26447 [Cymbomonas tetramitiformis]